MSQESSTNVSIVARTGAMPRLHHDCFLRLDCRILQSTSVASGCSETSCSSSTTHSPSTSCSTTTSSSSSYKPFAISLAFSIPFCTSLFSSGPPPLPVTANPQIPPCLRPNALILIFPLTITHAATSAFLLHTPLRNSSATTHPCPYARAAPVQIYPPASRRSSPSLDYSPRLLVSYSTLQTLHGAMLARPDRDRDHKDFRCAIQACGTPDGGAPSEVAMLSLWPLAMNLQEPARTRHGISLRSITRSRRC